MTLTSHQRRQVMDRIRDLVLTKHINATDPDQDYGRWTEQFEKNRPELLNTEPEEFERQMQGLLYSLNSSHTTFFHGIGSGVPAQYAIHATLNRVDSPREGARWMFCDVVEDGPAHQAGIRPGHLLLRQAGKDVLPPAQPLFRIGASCLLTTTRPAESSTQDVVVTVPNRAAKDRPPMVEPRSVLYRMLAPAVGYIRIHSFPGANGAAFARALDAGVARLVGSGATRLIVDLRGNMGGGIGSLRLMSYLCPDSLPVGYSVTRRKHAAGFDKRRLITIHSLPSSKAAMVWMFVKFRFIHRDRSVAMFTEGLGQQPFHSRIVMLVNEHTKSAAEMVASFAKENRLATLVGARTAGEVLGGATFDVGHGYKLRIPVAGWYNWEGVCIEGAGVEPAVAVRQSPEDLAAGTDTQLATAIRIATAM
jgi:C-terminal processing protease CtpA/Prc